MLKKEPKWTDDTIIKELAKIKSEIGHFPKQKEFQALKRVDLARAIARHGGTNRFREMLGEEIIQVSPGYWTDETIIEELKRINSEIGHFPTNSDLIFLERIDLSNSIDRHDGTNRFREMLGEEITKASVGYWTDETIIEELKKIKDEIGHFPANPDLIFLERTDLSNAISINGGINKYREMLGYPASLHQKYMSDLMSYCGRRGKGTENLVKVILQDWCNLNGYPEPEYNTDFRQVFMSHN